MSFGMRSGVHWIRENVPEIESANVSAAVVFANPGTDSSSTCPRAINAVMSALARSVCPTTLPWKISRTRPSSAAVRARSASLICPFASAISPPIGARIGPRAHVSSLHRASDIL